MINTQRFGWIRSHPDIRDRAYRIHGARLAGPAPLPSSVDLRPGCPPVYDQGDFGSCTANAIAAAIDFDRKKQGLPFVAPSRMFIYYNERVMEDTVKSDAGAEIRDGIKSVASLGACPESEWAYAGDNLYAEPDAVCYANAKLDLVSVYNSLDQSLLSLKSCLAGGFPFVFGITVYESFESEAVAQSGIVPMPVKDETAVGGHAVLAVGYDESKQMFLSRNSWGNSFGIEGYFWIPYSYLTDGDLADDFWVVNAVQSTEPALKAA